MITIIHGDNIAESRNYFLDLRSKQKNPVSFDGGKITLTDLVQNIEGSGLFNDTKTIFIEDLLAKHKKTNNESKEILNFIAKNSKNSAFILWESKELTKRDTGFFKNAVVKVFKLPKNIFLFLDNLKPGSGTNLLNLFHEALDSGIKEELILFMMQRQFRLLLSFCNSELVSESIDEVNRLAPWQREKLERQTQLFDTSKLKNIYKKLYEMELGQKTGALPLTLSQSIDFLLLEI